MTDVAVVDCVFSNSPSWSSVFLVGGTLTHLYVKDSEFYGGSRWGTLEAHNVVIEDTHWSDGGPGDQSGVTFRENR